MLTGSFKKFRLCAALLCVLFLFSFVSRLSEVRGEFSAEVNQLLVFFRDVLMIDTSHCTVIVNPENGDNNPSLGTRGEKQGKVTLIFDSGGSVDSLFEFRGKYLTWCLIYYDIGNKDPIPYIQPSSGDQFEMARGFLERYEKFTSDSTVGAMRDFLDTVDLPGNASKISGNLKMVISDATEPDFRWSYTFEGEDYSILSFSFFDPPHIFTLGDQRFRYNMDAAAFPSYEPLVSPNLEPAIQSSKSNDPNSLSEPNVRGNDFSTRLRVNSFLVALFASIAVVGVGVAGFIRMKPHCRRQIHALPDGNSGRKGGKPVA